MFGLAGALLFAGCGGGDDLELVDVSGTVNYRGAPIEDGAIRFVSPGQPTSTPKAAMPARTAQIVNGEYAATGRGGLAPGDYTVEIEAYNKDPGASADAAQEGGGALPDAMIVKKQVLPEKFNKKSEMKLTVKSGEPLHDNNYDLKE